MLANDSNEGKNQSAFFLVIRPHQVVAELMAECPSCGAMTSYSLELAWRLDTLHCSECQHAMILHEDDVVGFYRRARETMTRLEALLKGRSLD